MSATWDSQPEKTTPIPADEILLIDTEDSRIQKRALLSNLSGAWTRDAINGFVFDTTLTDFVGIGTNTPLAILNSLSTSEQLRLSYDVTNFASFTVGSGGDLTITPSGADTTITGGLTVVSTTDGFLPPVLTDTQRDAISSPASGLMIYDITNNDYNFYDGTSWRAILDASVASFTAGGIAFGSTNSDHSLDNSPDDFFWDNTNKRLGIGTNTPLANLHLVTSGTSGLGGVPGTRGLAITGTIGLARIFFEVTDATAGERVFQIENESGTLRFGSLNDTGGSFTNRNILVLEHGTGNVGIGTDSPLALLNPLAITEQLRLSFDATNFTSFTVDSSGELTITPNSTLTIEGNLSVDDAVMTPFGGLGQYQNLILQSEDFTSSSWIKVFGGTVTGDTTVAPNGQTTADTLDWTTGTSTLGFRQNISGIVASNTYTVSFWAQFVSGNTNVLSLDIGDGSAMTATIDSTSLKRYSETIVAGSGSFIDINNAGSNTGIFKMWGFQIVDGSETLPYSKTTTSQISVTFGETISGNLSVIGNIISPTITGDLTVDTNTLFVDSTGNEVGVGTILPLAKLNILETTEQLRLSYDVTNFVSFTTSSTGTLSIAPTGDNFLNISSGLDGEGSEFVELIPGGIESSVDLDIKGKSGSVTINHDSDGGAVFIGRDDVIQAEINGAVTIGTQSMTPLNNDGNVLTLGASTSDGTKTKFKIRSPVDSQDFEIGMNNLAVDSGSAFLDNTGNTEMRLKNTAGTAISISSLDIGFGITAPSAKVHILNTTEQLRLGFDATNYTSFTMDIGYELSTISYDSVSFSITSEEPTPRSFTFNSDGTKMYVVGQANDTVFQYTLSTGFDMSTASYDTVSLNISVQESTPRTITFNTAGTKMFILGSNSDSVRQYTLTTPDDLSTASFDSVSFSISSEDSNPQSLVFNADGTKMWMLGDTSDTIYQYTLSTANQVSTASYDNISFDVSSEDTQPQSIRFNSTFTKMWMVGDMTDTVHQYSLSTAEDISTATYDNISFNVGSEEVTPRSINFNSDGTKMYLLGNNMDTVFQYTLTPSLTISPTSKHVVILGETIIAGGNLSITSPTADTTAITNITTLGTNGGTSSLFVGDQDPDSTITGAGGDFYVRDSGALSKPFFNKEATTGTDWEGISLIPSEVHELFSTAEYEDLGTASVITTGAVTNSLNFKTTVTSSTRHVITSQDSELQFIDETEGNQMIYTGTSTFITAAVGGDITLRNAALIAAISGTKLFDYLGEGDLPGVDINEVVQSANLAQWDLGSIGRVSTGEFGPIIRFKDTNIISTTDPLVFDTPALLEITSCIFDDTANVGSGGPLFSIKNTGYKEGRSVFLTNGGFIYSGESLVRIDAGVPNDYRVQVIDSLFLVKSGGSIFDTSGSTGAFTSVADNSISSTAITSVTDSLGVASFTHAGTSPLLGSLVTVSGFTTNTSYNTTGIVTARTSTTFEIDYVAFGTTETGSYEVTSVTVTATAHGLSLSTGVTLDTTLSADYDGGFLIYNIQTNSFDVPATFVATEAGTWSTKGLDQTDPRVRAFNNPGTNDSHSIATAFVNDNSTANGTIINNVFTDMVFGTGGSALIAGSTMERWKLVDELNGTFEYIGLDPFDGLITFDFTAESSGGTVKFRFEWHQSIDTTITATTIAFVNSNPDTITDSGNGFLTAGFAAGDQISVSGSTSNDGNYTIDTVVAGTITLVASDTLTVETAGASVTINGLFGNLPDPVEGVVAIGSDADSITKTFPLAVVKGDRIKPQITRNSGSSGITTTHATIYATM